jgi:hypothetical protein
VIAERAFTEGDEIASLVEDFGRTEDDSSPATFDVADRSKAPTRYLSRKETASDSVTHSLSGVSGGDQVAA